MNASLPANKWCANSNLACFSKGKKCAFFTHCYIQVGLKISYLHVTTVQDHAFNLNAMTIRYSKSPTLLIF
jgi:hypothetical protein